MRFSWNAKCKIWSRACRIDSWQKQLCIFVTRMSILIFIRVLENSSQRAYFRSCDENTATPLADKREIGRFMGFPVPYWNILLVCLCVQLFSVLTFFFTIFFLFLGGEHNSSTTILKCLNSRKLIMEITPYFGVLDFHWLRHQMYS